MTKQPVNVPGESLHLLEQLCAIDSRTVEGASGTTQVAEIVAERFRPLGFDIDWMEVGPGENPAGRHLKAVYNAEAATRIVLIGHTDTVMSPSEVPFHYDAASGRAYGAGVSDMKGGCVLMIDAIRMALKEYEAVRRAGMTVLLNCTEEQSGPSFPALLRREAHGAAACLTFEPSGTDGTGAQEIVVARKGVMRFELTCYGRSAHAGSAHATGLNAIRELARKVEQIETITDYNRDLTANVGRIRGGRVSNQVPEEASAEFELRAFDRGEMDRAREAVRRICSEATVHSPADGASVRCELEEPGGYPPWPRNAATDALAERYIAGAQRHGVVVRPVCRAGASDASHSADSAPTLDGLGIVGNGLHSNEEWADMTTLPVRAQIAADLLADICSPPLASDQEKKN